MSEELFRKIIEDLSANPPERLLLYLMNEPLLDRHLVERISYAKNKLCGSLLHFLTNGVDLDHKLAGKLIASPLDWIGFSVHAHDQKTYQAITGRADFPKIKENIRDFIRLAKHHGKNISDYILVNITRSPDHLFDAERQEAFNYWKNLGIERIEYFDHPISRAGNVKGIKPAEHQSLGGCGSIWATEMLHILYNGDVVPCCMDWSRKEILGNVGSSSLSEIWNGPAYEDFREKMTGTKPSDDHFLCKRCEAAIERSDRSITEPISFAEPIDLSNLHRIIHLLSLGDFSEFRFERNCGLTKPATLHKFLDLSDQHRLAARTMSIAVDDYGSLDRSCLRKLADKGLQRLVHYDICPNGKTFSKRKNGVTLEHFEEIIATSAELGLINDLILELCFPGETERDFEENVLFILRNLKALNGHIDIKPFGFQRDSEYYQDRERYGIVVVDENFLDGWHYQGYNNHSYRRKKTNEFQIILNHLGIRNKMHVLKLIERRNPKMEEAVLGRLLHQRKYVPGPDEDRKNADECGIVP